MPAWLISMLFHMAVLALLALLFFDGGKEEDLYITLSTEANRFNMSGGDATFQNPADPFHYDLPVPKDKVPKTQQQRRAMAKAKQDAKSLRVDPGASMPQLPALQQVKQRLRSTDATQRTLAARDPRVRVEMVSKEGGTTLTEAAVARGLRWLAQHQNSDGSWSLQCSRTSPCRGRCGNDGNIHSDSAATSLALLPFLGAGQTHQVGIYKDTVAKGLRWMLQMQEENGDLRGRSQGNAGMYAHGQGAIVLCEAYALTGDEQLHQAAQRSIDFIADAQHAEGGWRYTPGDPGDTSVLGWQLMALQSARAAQLDVQPENARTSGYLSGFRSVRRWFAILLPAQPPPNTCDDCRGVTLSNVLRLEQGLRGTRSRREVSRQEASSPTPQSKLLLLVLRDAGVPSLRRQAVEKVETSPCEIF